MTNKTIFQEVAEKHGKEIENIFYKYKDKSSLEEIKEDLQFSFHRIIDNICTHIEFKEKGGKDEN